MTEYIDLSVKKQDFTLLADVPDVYDEVVYPIKTDDTRIARNSDTRVARNSDTRVAHNTTASYIATIPMGIQTFAILAQIPELSDTAVSISSFDTYIARNGDAYIERSGDTYIARNSTSANIVAITVKKQTFTLLAEVNPNG